VHGDYPLQKKRHSFEYLRDHRPSAARTKTLFGGVTGSGRSPRSAVHKFFQERDFVYVNTPLITGSDCEGAGENVPGEHP
jgi:asparaginyl-tRNA synthetase